MRADRSERPSNRSDMQRRDSIGTVTSNGPSLSLTPAANFDVTVQQSNKTPAQIAQEFSAFQAALDTYNVQKQIDPNLPQHTENGGTNNANPHRRELQVRQHSTDPPPTTRPLREYRSRNPERDRRAVTPCCRFDRFSQFDRRTTPLTAPFQPILLSCRR